MNTIKHSWLVRFSAVPATILLCLFDPAKAEVCEPVTQEYLCANAPIGAPKDHCMEIASYLIDFQQTVCSLPIPDPDYYPRYAGESHKANSHLGDALLGPGVLDSVRAELDAYSALGVSVYRIDIHYPMLTPAFHAFLSSQNPAYTSTVDHYLEFYQTISLEAVHVA